MLKRGGGVKRQIRYQREADSLWAQEQIKLPGCERLFSCIQCGVCSGSCPLSIYMDYTPRRIIALAREGFKKEVLSSQTIWLCASCYACAVRCPQKISITDVMYSLKQEAIQTKLYPRSFPIPVLAQEFYKMVKNTGRNSEFWLILKMALRSNPMLLLTMFRVGLELLWTKRVSLRQEKIKQIRQLKSLLEAE